MKFSSGKSVAAWSTSETSKASLSSGQMVGPLWTWMFLMPSSWLFSRNRYASGSFSVQPRDPSRHSAVYSLTPLWPYSRHVLLELLDAGVAVPRVPASVDDELVGMLRGQRAVLLGGVEARGVPLREVGRLEDGLVDVPVLEHVLHQVLFRGLVEVLEGPVRLGRAQALIGVEALDPAFGVLLSPWHPVLRTGVPVVHVAVDDEVLVAILFVQRVLLRIRGSVGLELAWVTWRRS